MADFVCAMTPRTAKSGRRYFRGRTPDGQTFWLLEPVEAFADWALKVDGPSHRPATLDLEGRCVLAPSKAALQIEGDG